MAEDKNLLDSAKEMLGDGNILDKAKDFIGDKAGDLLENVDELKEKAVEIGKKITPDSLDDKVEGVVDQAIDMIKGIAGKKEE